MEPRRDILREQLRGYLAEELASLQHLKLEEVAGLLQNVDGPLEMTVPVDLALLMDVGASCSCLLLYQYQSSLSPCRRPLFIAGGAGGRRIPTSADSRSETSALSISC